MGTVFEVADWRWNFLYGIDDHVAGTAWLGSVVYGHYLSYKGVIMSNDVCGYVHPPLSTDTWAVVERYILDSELGLFKISSAELFN